MRVFYTDGSCLKNPGGPGGWALAEINKDDVESYIYGGEAFDIIFACNALGITNTKHTTKSIKPLITL